MGINMGIQKQRMVVVSSHVEQTNLGIFLSTSTPAAASASISLSGAALQAPCQRPD
jgi:hypothetical protein